MGVLLLQALEEDLLLHNQGFFLGFCLKYTLHKNLKCSRKVVQMKTMIVAFIFASLGHFDDTHNSSVV